MTDDLLPEAPQARAILAALELLQQAGINAQFEMCLPDSHRITLPPLRAIYAAVAMLQAEGLNATIDTDANSRPIQITIQPSESDANLESYAMAAKVYHLQTLQATQAILQAKSHKPDTSQPGLNHG